MKRRGFFGFLGGAVAAGPQATQALAESTLRQAGFPMGSEVGCALAPKYEPPTNSIFQKLIGLIRKEGVPEWKMHEIRMRAEQDRFGLDADIAVLRSVSPGWKAREQRKRNLQRAIDRSLASLGRNEERQAWSKAAGLMGFHIDWYE